VVHLLENNNIIDQFWEVAITSNEKQSTASY